MYSVNSLKWKRSIARFYHPRQKTGRKIILIYHAVGNGPWAISLENFNGQIQWLKKNCEIVSLSELLTSQHKKNITRVALTFDDGYACLHDTVLPILKTENAVAAVYINTGWMADNEKTRRSSHSNLGHYPSEKFLTWDEVKMLSQSGWEIGSHGVEHIDLTKQPTEIIKTELVHSKSTIENFLQKKCGHFAYTWGRYNAFLENATQEAGYEYAVAAHHGVIDHNKKLFSLPRMNVALEYTLSDFERMINGRWDFLGHVHHLKKKLKMD